MGINKRYLNQMVVTREKLAEICGELFKAVDKDGSGFLEKGELRECAGKIHEKFAAQKEGEAKPFPEEKFEKGFEKLDKNGDGKISLEEAIRGLTVFAENHGLLKD